MKVIWRAFRTKAEWFLNIASHSGDIEGFVKTLVTSSVALKDDKSQNVKCL